MSRVGKHNNYRCFKCGKSIITIDRDEGVAPWMLICRATPNCKGMMYSSFYRITIIDFLRQPQWEWCKPTPEQYSDASPGMREHFDKGGLDIYPIERQSHRTRTREALKDKP